jgi:glycolate oxidase iron-sulfur subunit
MQTTFTPQQIENPRIAEADGILRSCVHCGLCTAVCPTYVLLGDERDSPRGRIYLIKDMYERGGVPSGEVAHHIDRCLSCLSCTTTCPSGVDYMHLVDAARAEIHEKTTRSRKVEMARNILAAVVPIPRRFRLALKAARFGRPFVPLMRRFGFPELAAMVEMAPLSIPAASRFDGPGSAVTKTERQGRVILMTGCAQQVLRPSINDATIRLLARRGIDVAVAKGSGCCGALVHHMGRETEALTAAKANIDAWFKEMDRGPIEAVIINASGCGTTVKDYGHMLRHDPIYKNKAATISAMTRDIVEFLVETNIGPPTRWSSIRVAYHSACSMQHGQGITEQPLELLSNAGFSVATVPESHLCCGSAGTYNVMQAEIAGQLKARKIANIRLTKADVVSTGNIGCIAQLGNGMDMPIVHTVELLDWAYGGPVPVGLEHLNKFSTDVPPPRMRPEDYIQAAQ